MLLEVFIIELAAQKKLIKISATTWAGREYLNLFDCQRKTLDCLASYTSNTILYNLSFVPREVLNCSFVEEVVAAFAYLFPRYRFTTEDENGFYDEKAPARMLDVEAAALVADFVYYVLINNGTLLMEPEIPFEVKKIRGLPNYAAFVNAWEKGKWNFFYSVVWTVGYDEEHDIMFLDSVRVKQFNTTLLAVIEKCMQKRTGIERIRYMEQGIQASFDILNYGFEIE